jgi:hypothetical protein
MPEGDENRVPGFPNTLLHSSGGGEVGVATLIPKGTLLARDAARARHVG